MNESAPRVSVVVPVHNCEKTIGKCLDSLIAQDHPSFEVIVVDDGSTDHTARTCASYSQVLVLSPGKVGPSSARNLGIRAARGELVAFTDADCIADRDWLRELERGFTEPDVGGTGGDQKSPEDETETGRRVHQFLKTIGFVSDYVKTGQSMRETEHNPTCTSMYRKRVLHEVGGFNENLWPGEDVELDLKVRRRGYRLMYNPRAQVAHYRPATCTAFARMLFRYGRAQGYLVRSHGPFRLIHYVPILIVFGCTALAATTAWEPMMMLTLLGPFPLFLGWFTARTRSLATGMQFTVLIVITLACWNWGFFSGFLCPRGSGC